MKHNIRHLSSRPREIARAFIQESITRCAETKTFRLPPIAAMAKQAGVSLETMWKVVDEFKREGILQARPRSGIIIRECRHQTGSAENTTVKADTCNIPSAKRSRIDELRGQLERDILTGVLHDNNGRINIKTLLYHYGTCYRTIRAAFHILEEENLVERYKRSFRLVHSHAHHRRILVLVAQQFEPHYQQFLPLTHTVPFYSELEHQCTGHNLALRISWGRILENRTWVSDDQRLNTFSSEPLKSSVAGFLFWNRGLTGDVTASVVDWLKGTGKPVSVIDEIDPQVWQTAVLRSCNVQRFQLGHTLLPGREMGRHLLALGHRDVAYLSIFHSEAYSQSRLDGLREVFFSSGLHCAIHPFTTTGFHDFKSAVDFHDRHLSAIVKIIDDSCRKFERVFGSNTESINYVREQMNQVFIRSSILDIRMRPLIEQVLRTPSITACVFANDMLACSGMRILGEKGIHVPLHMSVCGFDNEPDSLKYGLTSYNFNLPGIIHAALNAVLFKQWPPHHRGSGNPAPYEVRGTLLERSSTAAPPQTGTR